MLQRSALIVLAAAISLGLAAGAASAKPIIKPFPKPNPIIKPIFVPHWPHHPHWERRIVPIVTPVVVEHETTTRTIGPAPTPRRVCLTKEHLPNGAVLFRDVCTNEWAQNPPPDDQPQQPPKPQAEMQTGK